MKRIRDRKIAPLPYQVGSGVLDIICIVALHTVNQRNTTANVDQHQSVNYQTILLHV